MSIGSSAGSVGREGGRVCSALITSLLRRIGKATDDANNRSVAADALTQSVHEYNLMRLDGWLDRRLTTTITLVDATKVYSLPARYRKSVGRAWLLDLSGDRDIAVAEVSYQEYLHSYSNSSTQGDPSVFSIVNRINTGQLEVFPVPTTVSIAARPSLEITYFADIPVCGADNDTLQVSGGLEQAILSSALVTLNDMLGDPDRSAAFAFEAARFKREAVGYDNSMRLMQSNLRGFR